MSTEDTAQALSTTPAIDDPMNYLNRELSMLKFHKRVLYEALDPVNPLLERVRYLGIVGMILDEFFMVRVGGLMMNDET
ncbi:MAG: hypothetical protein ACK2TV_09240, partial [Anaerolineales bacterium]